MAQQALVAQPPQLLHGLQGLAVCAQRQGGAHAAAQAVEVGGLGLQVLASAVLEGIFEGRKMGKIWGKMLERCRKDVGKYGKYVANMLERCWKNVGKMWEKCGKYVGKMSERCGKNVGKIWEKC